MHRYSHNNPFKFPIRSTIDRAEFSAAQPPSQAETGKGKAWAALHVLPKCPWRELTGNELIFCFESLVGYFRSKKLPSASHEDLAQEVLLRASRVSPENTQHFLALWARRHFINCLRVNERRRRRIFQVNSFLSIDPIVGSENEKIKIRLFWAIEKLPVKLGNLVNKHYFDGDNQESLAERLGVHRNTIRRWLDIALSKLKPLLDIFSD